MKKLLNDINCTMYSSISEQNSGTSFVNPKNSRAINSSSSISEKNILT